MHPKCPDVEVAESIDTFIQSHLNDRRLRKQLPHGSRGAVTETRNVFSALSTDDDEDTDDKKEEAISPSGYAKEFPILSPGKRWKRRAPRLPGPLGSSKRL